MSQHGSAQSHLFEIHFGCWFNFLITLSISAGSNLGCRVGWGPCLQKECTSNQQVQVQGPSQMASESLELSCACWFLSPVCASGIWFWRVSSYCQEFWRASQTNQVSRSTQIRDTTRRCASLQETILGGMYPIAVYNTITLSGSFNTSLKT